jgi:hypothetical protein
MSAVDDVVEDAGRMGQLRKVRAECDECGVAISDPTDLDWIIGLARAHERNDEEDGCEMAVSLVFENGEQEVDWR